MAKSQQSQGVWATDARGRYGPYLWHRPPAGDLIADSKGKLQSMQKDRPRFGDHGTGIIHVLGTLAFQLREEKERELDSWGPASGGNQLGSVGAPSPGIHTGLSLFPYVSGSALLSCHRPEGPAHCSGQQQ